MPNVALLYAFSKQFQKMMSVLQNIFILFVKRVILFPVSIVVMYYGLGTFNLHQQDLKCSNNQLNNNKDLSYT